jgi:hypothetical protein
MGGQRPHVEIAAVIPDGQGKIVIGKRKGKTGSGMFKVHPSSCNEACVVEPSRECQTDAFPT